MDNSKSASGDPTQDSVPRPQYRYPNFESIVDTIKEHVDKDRSTMDPTDKKDNTYILQEGFLPEDRMWIQYVRDDRMFADSYVLYRPQIVKELVLCIEKLMASNRQRGLMVKGPQGVGKSYSLINLTRFLLSQKEYWVTIIPDCERWINEDSFFEFLLRSVGVDPFVLRSKYNPSRLQEYLDLISDIDTVLAHIGRKWVFIFDQVNRIFARPRYQQCKDIGVLPFPFVMMKHIIKPGRIMSIISASANNHVSYKANHEGFDEFDHPIRFERHEMDELYTADKVNQWDWKELMHNTGCVPWYLKRWVEGNTEYLGDVAGEIQTSLNSLRSELVQVQGAWNDIVNAAIKCVLRLPSDLIFKPRHFDRKYSVLLREEEKGEITIIALFPFIDAVYRIYFWEELQAYIGKELSALLHLFAQPNTTNDVRGRLFEQIVTWQLCVTTLSDDDLEKILKAGNISIQANDIQQARNGGFSPERFDGQAYPSLTFHKSRTVLFIPNAPNFPAVDLLFVVGNVVITFQIHTSGTHSDTLPLLKERVKKAGWKDQQIHTVFLVYLSPDKDITNRLKRKLETSSQAMSASSDTNINYVSLHCTLEDFQCFEAIRRLSQKPTV